MSKSAASEKQSAAHPFPSAPPVERVIWRFPEGGNTHFEDFSFFMTPPQRVLNSTTYAPTSPRRTPTPALAAPEIATKAAFGATAESRGGAAAAAKCAKPCKKDVARHAPRHPPVRKRRRHRLHPVEAKGRNRGRRHNRLQPLAAIDAPLPISSAWPTANHPPRKGLHLPSRNAARPCRRRQ